MLGQKKYAEPLLLQGYERLKQREAQLTSNRKVRLSEALERLVLLYEAMGQKKEVDAWRRKLKEREAAVKAPATPGRWIGSCL